MPDKVVMTDGKPVLNMKGFGNGYRITASNHSFDQRFVTIVLVKQASLR